MYTEVKEILLRLRAIASTQVKSTVSGVVVLAFEVRTPMTTIVELQPTALELIILTLHALTV